MRSLRWRNLAMKQPPTLGSTLIEVLQFWSEGMSCGNFAASDLPSPERLKRFDAWVAAWESLPSPDKAILGKWWNSKQRVVA
jgi:hypothetical protein